ncbi:putative transcriptional regulatory protein Aasi_0624 [Xylocopa sonorina]|uniref:putative transcriptional regulatory protein Aasi_0624 n=1 Tax=Xylocopa sonorina TaxID=1818115 RepID=UPI00403B086D
MRYRLNVLLYNTSKHILTQETRRYAGHSKWQNIKHIKQEQDMARSLLFRSLLSKMKAVITESGNSDPTVNPRLANLIDQAKKANMPAATLKTFFDRIKNSDKCEKNEIMIIRTSSKVILILHIETSNINLVKPSVNNIIKKFNSKLADKTTLTMFDCSSYITATKDCTLDQAEEDAIEADAQNVEEVKLDDMKCFQFQSEFLFPDKVISRLINLGYDIVSTENKCIPNCTIELREEQLTDIDKLKQKLLDIKEIKKIEDNIAH